MAAITIQRALTCSPRAVAMIAKAIAPRMPTRTQGPCDRRVVVMAFPIPVRLLIVNDYAPARQVWEAGGPSVQAGAMAGVIVHGLPSRQLSRVRPESPRVSV